MNDKTTEHGGHDQQPLPNKLKQLALYIARRSERDPKFGSVKFNKLLFAADVMCYLKTGCSITGFAYIKKQFGPCPEGFDTIQGEMIASGQLAIQEVSHYGRPQKRPIALAVPDLSSFSGEEIATVDEVIQDMSPLNGTQASDWSHNYIGWKVAKDQEKIPYSLARLGFDYELTEYHYELGRQVAEQIAKRLAVTD